MQCGAQVNVMRHNCISLPSKKTKGSKNPNPIKGNKTQQQKQPQQQQSYSRNPNQHTSCDDSPNTQGFNCPAKKYQCKNCKRIGHSTEICFTKNAQPQSEQQFEGWPKQAYQIIVSEQPNAQYESSDNIYDSDDFIIAYQICAQPQKTDNS